MYDTVNGGYPYRALRGFRILIELIGPVQMTHRDTMSKVEVEGGLSQEFEVRRGLRRGDMLSRSI